jgi:iron complex outermembrane receptor protein
MRGVFKNGLGFGVSLAVMAAAAPAWAQEASDNSEADESGDIIVTAQRREESLQNVPLAITAFGSDQLAKTGSVSINDISTRTPSFVIGQQGPSSPDMSIRGIGSSDRDAGSERSVIAFVDEVYTGRAGGIPVDLFDLERVEVLRGPQGTLYGKNAVGGAVNLITRKPSEATDVRGEITVANFDSYSLRFAAGGRLADGLSARIALSGRTQDGYYVNRRFNQRTDDYKMASGRGQLRYTKDALDLLLSVDHAYDEYDGISTVVNPISTALTATGFAAGPGAFDSYNNILGRMERHNTGITFRADVDLDWATLTALTGYRHLDLAEDRDLAGVPLRAGPTGATLGFESTQLMTEETASFSQELRLTSNGSGPFRYVVGLYYQQEDTSRTEERKRQLNAAISRPVFAQENVTKSYSIFGQASWEMVRNLTLTIGGRYTIDKKDFGLTVTNPFGFASLSPATQLFSVTAQDEWKAFTPKATLDFQFAPDLLGYVTVSRGFKSGGYQGLAATAGAARTSFNPEFATNYEAGLKMRFFDRKFTFNIAAFQIDFKDLQFRQRILTIPNDQASAIVIVANAGEARIKGLEIESQVKPVDWLAFNLSYSLLDTQITKFNVTPGVTDVTGSDLARAPKGALSSSVDLNIPVGDFVLGANLEYQHRSSFRFEPGVDRALLEPGYSLWNARVSLAPSSKDWSIEAWMRNIGDTRYRTFAQAIGFAVAGNSAATARLGDPKTYGLTLRASY